MKLNQQHITSIEKSVLCWLATVSVDGQPSVSPKEIFTNYEDDKIIIANIASPQSVSNIQENNQVCVSILDILVQKGFQIKGKARIIKEDNDVYLPYRAVLNLMVQDKFPFQSVIEVNIESVKEIIAPSYRFYPNVNEQDMIDQAREIYGL